MKRTITRENIVAISENNSASYRGWLIWFIAASFLLFQFFMQLTSGIILSGVQASFHINYFWATLILSSYYYVYVLAQVPAGMLVDRFGPRHLLTVGALIVAVGCVIFATTNSIVFAMCARLLMGAGASCAFVSCLNLIKQWFPANRFSWMTSLSEMFGMLGAIIGSVSLAFTVETYGWQKCTLAMAVIALVFSLLIWFIIKERSNKINTVKINQTATMPAIKLLLRNKTAWVNGLYSALIFGVISVFVALWGVKFFQATHHNISLFSATLTDDIIFLGTAIACPIIGFIDSHTNWRYNIMWISPIVGAIILAIIIFCPLMSNALLYPLLFILGVCLSSYVLNFVIANNIAEAGSQGIHIGFVNMLSVGSAPIIQPLIGFMMDDHNCKQANLNILQYQHSLWIIPVMLLLAGGLALFLPKTK